MPTAFAWLDNDDEQRRRMLELVRLFQDQDTVDELGIGSVRDTFSNAFFPGTSVLHTRAKYLLFVPWLLRDIARHGWPVERARAELRSKEAALIDALLAGGETDGVIGRQARRNLKTWPSTMYWSGLKALRIVQVDTTLDGLLRHATLASRRGKDVTEEDIAEGRTDLGLTAALPPAPSDLGQEATFELEKDEADFLRARLAILPHSPLFSWLANHATTADAAWIWEHPQLGDFPDHHQEHVDHARRFHHAIHGAALVYNHELSVLRGDEAADLYAERLTAWEEELNASRALDSWDRTRFWSVLDTINRTRGATPISYGTKTFITRWLDLLASSDHNKAPGLELICHREQRLKGRRSRFTNPEALQHWNGSSGLVRLDYRWGVASGHLRDVLTGLEAA